MRVPVNLPRRGAGAVLLAATALALAATALAASPASVTQQPGKSGCVANFGWKGQCARGRGIAEPFDLAVSPDGRNVYVAGGEPGSLAIFDRLPGSGRLRQKHGAAGCVAAVAIRGCARGVGLGDAEGVAVSPDGRSVYLATGSGVAIFDRDGRTGDVRQKHGRVGCISARGSGGACRRARGLGSANGVVVSADGRDVYVTSFAGIAVFERDPRTGALRQPSGAGGCVALAAKGGCAPGHSLQYPSGLALSPNGRSLYMADYEPGSLVIFDRNPATGALTEQPGTAACFSEAGGEDGCQKARIVGGATAVVVSPDGANVYLAAAEEGGLAIFDRDRADGSLTQPPGKAGCVSSRGNAEGCAGGTKMRSVQGVAISPRGNAVYAFGDSALEILERNRSNGTLTQLPGKAGCIAEHGAEGRCQDGAGLADGYKVTVSPDGRNVYGVSIASSAVSVFSH